MKFLIFLAATILVVQAVNIEHEWAQFKQTHNKSYKNPGHEHERLAIFKSNLGKIEEHNKKFEQGLTTYKMGINQFADVTAEEFQKFLTLTTPEAAPTRQYVTPKNPSLDDTVDWRNKGAVTHVKDQGQCGACWAFATTGALEAQWFFKTGKLEVFSEQCLIDCSGSYGNNGCSGGWMSNALNYIKDNGIAKESEYPYEGAGKACAYTPSGELVTIIDFIEVHGETDLKTATCNEGPIAVAIEASSNFMLYTSGVFDDPTCTDQLNHGVLVIGYGTDGEDYWLVKNSWSANWGEQGYIRMARNKNNQCGIADYGYYPVL